MSETATKGMAAMRRALALAAAWAVLVEGRPGDLLIGLPVAGAIALYSLRLNPPDPQRRRWRPLALAAMAPRVAWLTLVGGVDVAVRALRSPPDLDPTTLTYVLDPPSQRVAIGLSVLMTLMPGTLAADVSNNRILVHVLDRTQPVERSLRALEDGLRRGLGEDARHA